MKIDESTALVDTDFISHVAEIDWDCSKICSVLCAVFRALEVFAAVHPLVYEKEIPKDNGVIVKFFDDNIIACPSFEDFFENSVEKDAYYTFVMSELFRKFTGDSKGLDYIEVYSYWEKGCSLGELHSIAMCITCGCGMFLSDDSDSKSIVNMAQDICPERLKVYNRCDVTTLIREQGCTVFEGHHDRRAFAHMAKS